MSKLSRIFHKVFGANANFTNQMGVFGSFKNGTPTYASNAEDIQSLGNWLGGLYDSIVGNNSPILQDINGVLHHASRQIGYIMQSGVPEWDSQTSYYVGSFVNYNNTLYVSIVDDNLNQDPVSQPTKWVHFLAAYLASIGVSLIPTNDSSIDIGSSSKFWKRIYTDVMINGNASISALDIDWSTGTNFYKSISADSTFTFSNAQDGQQITVAISADSTQRSAGFPTAKWYKSTPFSVVPANKTNVYTFIKINGTIYASVVDNMG